MRAWTLNYSMSGTSGSRQSLERSVFNTPNLGPRDATKQCFSSKTERPSIPPTVRLVEKNWTGPHGELDRNKSSCVSSATHTNGVSSRSNCRHRVRPASKTPESRQRGSRADQRKLLPRPAGRGLAFGFSDPADDPASSSGVTRQSWFLSYRKKNGLGLSTNSPRLSRPSRLSSK